MTPLIRMLFSADGRIRRRDWWLYSMLIVGLSFVLFFTLFFVMAVLIGLKVLHGLNQVDTGLAQVLGLIYFPIYCWMLVCVTAKRWHDRDKSGYMSLLGFIPVIGGLWTLVECGILDGTHGKNRYGPSPKGIDHAEDSF